MFPVLLVLLAVAAQAQRYNKIVVFGDSLSDTGNDFVAFVTSANPIPFPSALTPIPEINYTFGRFTDGPDTMPSAKNPLYQGVWVEQLANALPTHPSVLSSELYPGVGTNHAFGFGNTFSGDTLFVLIDQPPLLYEASVENVGQQIDDYLATNPTIDDHTLFVVWAGANNLTEAVGQPNAPQLIVDGAIAQISNIQRLIDAGGTQFLVPNLPNLGLVPRFNGSTATSKPFHDATVLYNDTLNAGVSLLPLLNFGRHVTIHKFDVFSLLGNIVDNPVAYGFNNVTDESQENPAVMNPDTYLFWDSLHPTTHGHYLLGLGALEAIEPAGCVIVEPTGQYEGSPAQRCR